MHFFKITNFSETFMYCSEKEEKKMTDKKGHPVHVVD